jgi:hypothetical protein
MVVCRVADAMTTKGGCGGGDSERPPERELARYAVGGAAGVSSMYGSAEKPPGRLLTLSLSFEQCRCSRRLGCAFGCGASSSRSNQARPCHPRSVPAILRYAIPNSCCIGQQKPSLWLTLPTNLISQRAPPPSCVASETAQVGTSTTARHA